MTARYYGTFTPRGMTYCHICRTRLDFPERYREHLETPEHKRGLLRDLREDLLMLDNQRQALANKILNLESELDT
jgi:hypothetical protein